LEGIRKYDPGISFCQASSAEMFGDVDMMPQTELTPMRPKSFYGAAKVYAHNLIRTYRDVMGLQACSAILYNHESPRRSPAFVTRKISQGAAAIALGQAQSLTLGSLDMERDWGYAPEYIEAMLRMASADEKKDYILATGTLRRISEVCEICFGYFGLDYRKFVKMRKSNTSKVLGDASAIKRDLGWKAQSSLEKILIEMVEHDHRLMIDKKGLDSSTIII
jgi:GDPmannose 4,6-dehydratase